MYLYLLLSNLYSVQCGTVPQDDYGTVAPHYHGTPPLAHCHNYNVSPILPAQCATAPQYPNIMTLWHLNITANLFWHTVIYSM
jgi:hypothetical protein